MVGRRAPSRMLSSIFAGGSYVEVSKVCFIGFYRQGVAIGTAVSALTEL